MYVFYDEFSSTPEAILITTEVTLLMNIGFIIENVNVAVFSRMTYLVH